MVYYSKMILETLDKIFERLVEENNIIQKGQNNFTKYVADYIIDSMAQYRENDSFKMNLTNEMVNKLYEYNEDRNLLEDIIIYISEDEDNNYPLVLDFWLCYEMIIDFASALRKVKCLNCGTEFYVTNDKIIEDELGYFIICKNCNATFNCGKGE